MVGVISKLSQKLIQNNPVMFLINMMISNYKLNQGKNYIRIKNNLYQFTLKSKKKKIIIKSRKYNKTIQIIFAIIKKINLEFQTKKKKRIKMLSLIIVLTQIRINRILMRLRMIIKKKQNDFYYIL